MRFTLLVLAASMLAACDPAPPAAPTPTNTTVVVDETPRGECGDRPRQHPCN
jgi:hypothetical protein